MRAGPLLHPNLLSSLDRFHPVTVTIQDNTPAQDSVGHPVASWADLAGHVDLPGALVARSGSEEQGPLQTTTMRGWTVALQGYYPDVTTEHRAVIDGVVYDIDRVYHDSHGTMTRLEVEVVE